MSSKVMKYAPHPKLCLDKILCIGKVLMKRNFVTVLPVVIGVDSIHRFSLWAIVSANLVVKKTKTDSPVLEPTLSRLGEEKTFYGYLRTEILYF